MLSDMHDKLSQAVKLYDQILTQQVAQPRWRTTAVTPTPYQQSFSTGYSQWASRVQTSPTSYQVPPETPLSPQRSYASPSPTPAQLPHWNRPQQSQYQPQPHQASSPPKMIPSQTSAPPSQYAQYQHYASTPSTSQNVTLYSYSQPQSNQTAAVQNTPSFTPTSPVSLARSPPPTQYQPTTPQAPVAPTLARANSVAYTSAIPASHIARHNTIASHAPTQQYQQRQQNQAPLQQQHQPHQIALPPPAPPSLPQFPVVPTAAPQPTFPMYGSTISSGFEERKEALLIDL